MFLVHRNTRSRTARRTDKDLADPANVSLGPKGVQRWNLPGRLDHLP
jgi:hypothetical protein